MPNPESAPECELTPLTNFALTLGKADDNGDSENEYCVAVAEKAVKIQANEYVSLFQIRSPLNLSSPEEFLDNVTLKSAEAKNWLSARLSAAHSLNPRAIPSLWIVVGTVLMETTTWSKMSSDEALNPGRPTPFDPTVASTIRRSSLSGDVRPTVGMPDEVERGQVSGYKILETGKYPGRTVWHAWWAKLIIKIVPLSEAQRSSNYIKLNDKDAAVIKLKTADDKEGETGVQFTDEDWDALLEKVD